MEYLVQSHTLYTHVHVPCMFLAQVGKEMYELWQVNGQIIFILTHCI